jgi:hypothetical protein
MKADVLALRLQRPLRWGVDRGEKLHGEILYPRPAERGLTCRNVPRPVQHSQTSRCPAWPNVLFVRFLDGAQSDIREQVQRAKLPPFAYFRDVRGSLYGRRETSGKSRRFPAVREVAKTRDPAEFNVTDKLFCGALDPSS